MNGSVGNARALKHGDDVLHVDVADLLAGDVDLGDGGEGDVVAVEHAFEVEDRLAPVVPLGVVVGDVEPGVASDLLGLALGTKWSALSFIAVFGIMTVLWDMNARRLAGIVHWARAGIVKDGIGAFVAVVTWVLASVAFGFYVSNFGSYNKTYGALAGVVVFLLWLWITNLALLFGAEVDSELTRVR